MIKSNHNIYKAINKALDVVKRERGEDTSEITGLSMAAEEEEEEEEAK